ncbi:IS3 family transposase [Oceanimonas sp. GK1]|uniref:IS3 family transposase n=1 Tax=Oceanimonas sp. (strain GK1 / IBRC-M 10197) TaxID=511062 RepID=UPI0011D251C0|nr:IS3 family transposase [Oceanimonas sp. GK1]
MKYKPHRHFSDAFKREAVEASLSTTETQAQLAGRLGIHPNQLSRWRREWIMTKKSSDKAVENIGPEKSLQDLERENARLKKLLERKELENEILKKAQGVLRQAQQVRFAFIEAHRSQRWRVSIMCEVLNVSRAGYYRWRARQHAPGERVIKRQTLKTFLLERARQQKNVPGYRKLWLEARDAGFCCGKNQVQRLLRDAGYHSCTALKAGYQKPTSFLPVLPNLLNRRFSVGAANRVWVSDITQIRCHEGWLYIAVVLDLGTRRVVSRAMGAINSAQLVLEALEQAWQHQRPDGTQLLFHSDQGSQYRSEEVMRWLTTRGITISMSRRGNCWDNACSESFFALLKKEWTHPLGMLGRDEMADEVRYYTDEYYPKVRRHMALGGITPNAYAAAA